jgi:hypothetical protein
LEGQKSNSATCDTHDISTSITWLEVSFLLTTWNYTALGEQQLFSEIFILLLRHHYLPKEYLAPALSIHSQFPMQVSHQRVHHSAHFWKALGVSLRPLLHITVSVPFDVARDPPISSTDKLPVPYT